MARRGRRIARGQYRYTPRRQQALRKAQMISARKRKGLSRNTKIGIAAGVGTAALLGTAVARHKISGSSLSITARRKPVIHRRDRVEFSTGVHGRTGHQLAPFGTGGYGPNAGEVRYRTITAGGSVRKIGGLSFHYVHKPMTGQQAKEAVFGKKTPSGGPPPQARPTRRHPIDRDAIPHANTRTGQRSWPHVGADIARTQNEGVRNGTHYVSPTGVKKFPETAKGRAVVEEKIVRRTLGLGFTVAGQRETLFAESVKAPAARRRRRKRKKKS